MPQFDSAGEGLARGLATGFAIRNQRDRLELEKGLAEAERIRGIFDKNRATTMKMFESFQEADAKLGEQGFSVESPERQQIRNSAQGALASHGQAIKKLSDAGGGDIVGEDPSAFLEQNMQVFDAGASAARAAEEEVKTFTPEQVAEVGLPVGSLVQEEADGTIKLVFDPTDDESTLEERVGLMNEAGMDPTMSNLIAAGAIGFGLDPVTREPFAINLGTGDRIGGDATPPTPTAAAPVVTPGTKTGAGVGLQGAASKVGNIISDTLGLGLIDPDAQQAEVALEIVAQTTKLALQVAIPGRPAKDIREDLKKLTVLPADIFKGEERAKSSLEGMLRFIDNNITEKENALASDPLAPKDRSLLQNNIRELRQMKKAHEDLIAGFGVSGSDLRTQAFDAAEAALKANDPATARAIREALEANDTKALEALLENDKLPLLQGGE